MAGVAIFKLSFSNAVYSQCGQGFKLVLTAQLQVFLFPMEMLAIEFNPAFAVFPIRAVT